MAEKIPAPSREELRDLILRWQGGDITFYDAVEEAEAIEDRVWKDVDVIDFPPSDPRAVSTQVVSLLSMGFVQPLFVEDIPHLLACLAAAAGAEERALSVLWDYLATLSIAERLVRAEKEYSR